MDARKIEMLAQQLDQAFHEHQEIARITLAEPKLDIATAYDIQTALVKRQIPRLGPIIGYKMGLTSKAKMLQMGVHAPIFGPLLREMKSSNGLELSLKDYIHPKVEPEIVFYIKKELRGSVSADEAIDAIEAVGAGLEIIDSRYRNFEFELVDVIADNCSSTRFILGSQKADPHQVDLGNLGIVLKCDGEAKAFASSAAILGHPLASLCELVNLLAGRGLTLPAGSVVLAGGATAAIPLVAGHSYSAEFQTLGQVQIKVMS